ncbi:hypothetical protein F5Y06DRAFT_270782 [Hypoxylon sp. FL0890]|nr:hypothetical protein F5Y06DRAFT_270782 [Hypoxylon sp. FL0890]
MESPSKRLKIGRAPYDDDVDDETNLDELAMSPTQFNARQDPLYQLDKGRAKAATKLKSAFERIFEKYERDFTGIGDEIDLETGEVVINNGHLQSLEDEKDRTREGSISSNEEERIMRGKDIALVGDSQSKSLVRANSSTHNPPQGSLAIQNQPGIANGANYQPTPFGMLPNAPGFPNPYMFGPPTFNNGPIDPLWQAPEVPIALYQDRFGFMGQPNGYPPSFGYGYGQMLPPRGSFGNGPLSSLLRPQAPRKLYPTKPSGRKLLPRVSPAAEDSEEDDVLLGDNTQEVAKTTAIRNNKSSPLANASGNAMAGVQENEKQTRKAATEKASGKQRRASQPGRPRKAILPAKPLESHGGTIEQRDKGTGGTLNTQTSETASESTRSSATPLIPPQKPSEEESILAKQIAAKLAQAKAMARKSVESFDEQHRRSSRARKQTEFYSKITWTKSRPSRPDVTESATNDTPDPLPLDTNSSTGDIAPESSPLEDVRHPEPSKKSDKTSEAGPPRKIDDTPADQGNDQHESPVNQKDADIDKGLVESDSRGLHATTEDPGQPDPLFLNSKSNTKDIEIPPGDNETLSHGPSVDPPSEKESLHTSQDSNQDAHSNHEPIPEIYPDSRAEDMNIALDVKITVRDLAGNEVPGASKEIHESIFVPDGSQEETQTLSVQAEPDEVAAPLPGPVHEETQTTETEIVETELQLDDAATLPSPTEQVSEPPPLPEEDEAMSPPTELPTSSTVENEQVSIERSELAIRPRMSHLSPMAESERSERVDGAKSSSPTENRLPKPGKVTANTPVPRTPKKRRESGVEVDLRSSTHRRTSTKRTRSLTSLVPDEDDDELSVLSPSVTPNPFHSSSRVGGTSTSAITRSSPISAPRKAGRRQGFLLGPNTSTPHRISKRTAPPATDSRAFGSSKRRLGGTSSAVQSSPLARSVMHMDHSNILTATPSRRSGIRAEANPNPMSSSPTRTPGGPARRCGEDGFVCERDFCLTCCK